MNQHSILRIFIYVAVIFSIINGWWFIAFPLLLVGAWKFSFKAEFVIAGIMYDALFGMVRSAGLWGYIGTIISICVLIILYALNKVIR
jgi:hypothetical protein